MNVYYFDFDFGLAVKYPPNGTRTLHSAFDRKVTSSMYGREAITYIGDQKITRKQFLDFTQKGIVPKLAVGLEPSNKPTVSPTSQIRSGTRQKKANKV